MTDSGDAVQRRYSRDELHVLLAKAQDFDANASDLLTRAEVVQIAADLGISEHAINAALAEEQPSSFLQTHTRRGELLKYAAVGAVGSLALFLFGAGPVNSVLALETCSLTLAMASRGERRFRAFTIANAAFWGGAILGRLPGLLIVPGVIITAASTLLGYSAIVFRDWARGTSDPPSGRHSAAHPQSVSARLVRWVTGRAQLTRRSATPAHNPGS